jgi:hypothetical protein
VPLPHPSDGPPVAPQRLRLPRSGELRLNPSGTLAHGRGRPRPWFRPLADRVFSEMRSEHKRECLCHFDAAKVDLSGPDPKPPAPTGPPATS